MKRFLYLAGFTLLAGMVITMGVIGNQKRVQTPLPFVLTAQFVPNPAPSVDRYQPEIVLRRSMPAITNPPIVSREQVDLTDNELILGVVIDGNARAYPINQLTGPQREIINDTLGNVAIAATW